jgi:hypothetical protein
MSERPSSPKQNCSSYFIKARSLKCTVTRSPKTKTVNDVLEHPCN